MENDEKFGTLEVENINIKLDELSDDELAKIEEEIVKGKSEIRNSLDQILEIQ